VTGDRPGEPIRIRYLVTLVLFVGLLALSGSNSAGAHTPEIDRARAEAQALAALVDKLNQELAVATEEYNFANQQFEDTKAAVEKTSAELARAAQDMVAAQDRLNERLVSIYKWGSIGPLDAVLGAVSIADAMKLLDTLKWIGEQDAQIVDEIKSYEAERQDLKKKLDSELEQQEIYREQTAVARQAVLGQLTKQQEALKGKEAQLAQLQKAEAERQARLAAQERARKAWLATRPGKVVSLAMQYLGVRYVWGGASPNGFDCSGLVQYVYAKVGVALPHSSRMQYDCGPHVSRSSLRAGDLVFFFTPIAHVGIYIGNGMMVNATGNRVQISEVWPNSYRGACRVL
jgi:cell wall-associated NlpC family hydrolase